MSFKKATKHQARLRMALIGPAGSGKTYTALKLATLLGKRVAVIDTERGSACHYANKFDFDTCEPESFSPDEYVKTIHEAEQAGYDVLVIDSLSHAWSGKDGALEQVDRVAKRSQSGNSFNAWREVTPKHNALVDAMVGCRCHIIVTMRTKTEYVQEKDDRGKTVIRKVGLQPVQRDGLEYEFDVVGDMTIENDCIIAKTRCEMLTGRVFSKPGDDLAGILQTWLSDSQPRPEQPAATVEHKAEPPKSNGKSESVTPAQIATLHIRAKEIGLNDELYRQELQRYGVGSSKELTRIQAQQLLNDWADKGNGKDKPQQAQPATKPYQKPTDPPTPALWKRWQDLWNEAQQLGIEFEGVTPDISKADLIAKGQALKAKIDAWHDKPRARVDHEPIDQRPDTVEDGADVPGMDELERDAAMQEGMRL